jgi:hypothetical protein
MHALLHEALLMLEGKGAILDVARRVSHVLESKGLDGAIVGGVAVVLHGHIRTTVDVDIYTPAPAELADALRAEGLSFDPAAREFSLENVPVHLVTPDLVPIPPRTFVEIDAIRTPALADLINMKLQSGLSNMLRAQDIADVIGLIRSHKLRGDFARRLDKSLRAEFRKLASAVGKGV